jgi:hypothetical protein
MAEKSGVTGADFEFVKTPAYPKPDFDKLEDVGVPTTRVSFDAHDCCVVLLDTRASMLTTTLTVSRHQERSSSCRWLWCRYLQQLCPHLNPDHCPLVPQPKGWRWTQDHPLLRPHRRSSPPRRLVACHLLHQPSQE